MDIREFFAQHHQQAGVQLQQTKQALKNISLFRFGAFTALGVCVYQAIAHHALWWIAATVALCIFLWLMKRHAKLLAQKQLNETLSNITQKETTAFFSDDTGERFLQEHHPFAHDMDLFGRGSLFQYLNRTVTARGADALAHLLNTPLTKPEQIVQQQEAIQELSKQPEFLLNFRLYCTLATPDGSRQLQLLHWLQESPRLIHKNYLRVLLVLIPLLTLSGIVVAFTHHYFMLLIGGVLLNWLMVGSYLRYSNKVHDVTGRQKQTLEYYNQLNVLVTTTNFHNVLLNQNKSYYTQGNKAIQQLSLLVSTFDQRLNTMLGVVLNSLVLFDLQCLWRIELWKQKNGASLQQWLNQLGQTEMLVSLATYAAKHPEYTYPQLSHEPLYLQATALKHPMISAEKGVANDFTFTKHNKVFIITGSNMSGKSTFLRSLGTSLVCGMCGLPVHAQQLVFSPVQLFSSMRIADSLQEQTSYFYAELKRLKRMMDQTRNSTLPSVLFIDEMLKGTNSKEKLEGSIAVIETLIHLNCVAFIATHDLALGVLENRFEQQVQNYSFESSIVDNNLVFDYRIQRGVAQSTNATFLLRKMEIV